MKGRVKFVRLIQGEQIDLGSAMHKILGVVSCPSFTGPGAYLVTLVRGSGSRPPRRRRK
jgi:hypothetical protein